MNILDHHDFQQSFTAMMFAFFHKVEQGKETDQCATYSFALLFAKIELTFGAEHNVWSGICQHQFFWAVFLASSNY